MAISTRTIQNSDYGLSITGIAGPDGGSAEKPVGTVCFALATSENVFAQKIYFKSRKRNKVRELSCLVALDMLRRHLLGKAPVVSYSLFETIQSG
jgi:nicotinamide-nucleotide amidase